jgi:shikimate kinase
MSKVFLIGFMGVGKTTVGKRLAKLLDVPFMDTDHLIEATENETIANLFARKGEKIFREIEHKTLVNLRTIEHAVIATGGGLPCFHNNMDELLAQGTVIYLSRPESEIFQRLKGARTQRPIIANKTDEEIKQIIHQLLSEREPYYTNANITLDRNHQSPEEIVAFLNHAAK